MSWPFWLKLDMELLLLRERAYAVEIHGASPGVISLLYFYHRVAGKKEGQLLFFRIFQI